MLIIEIILVIFAWRNGWKWMALLPLVIAFVIGMLIGLSNPNVDLMNVVWIDILAILVLIGMLVKGKKEQGKKED